MADYNLGTAKGIIELEYKGDGVTQAKDGLKQTSKSAQDASVDLKKVSRNAGIAGLAIAGGLAVAVGSAASFEKRLSAVAAVSNATNTEMEAVRDKALQLGKDTAFSASESASAIEELVKAGLTVSDVLNGAADATVSLAAAGEVDLPQAAMIASNAMNQFALDAEAMPKVADLIAGAANASAIDVSDFGMSLSQVGAVANLAGVSFEDTAAAIALMGNAGIRGSDAGTSLKTMFQRLIPVTDKQTEEFKRLGLMTEDGANQFYDAQGNLKSFSDVAGILQNSLKGMTAEQKQATLSTLFGSDAIRAAAVVSEQGSAGFEAMAESMGKVTAAEVAEKRLDNLAGSAEKMKGALETAAISFGDALAPAIRMTADAISGLVDVFLGLPDGVSTGIAVFMAVAAAVLLVVAVVAKIIIMIGEFNKALVVLRGTMAATWLAALGPIALIVAAIAAVVAIVVILWKKSDTFRNIVIGVWNAIKTAVMAVVNWFTGTLVPAIVGVWNAIVAAVRTAVAFIATVIRTYIAIWKAIITTVLNAILAVWRAVWGLFGPIIKAVFGLIIAIIQLAWTIIKGLFLAALYGLKAVVQGSFRAILAVVRTVMNAIKAVISAVWKVIGPVVRGAVNGIKAVITGAWNAVKAVTSTVWGALKKVVSTAINGVVSVVRGLKDKVLSPLANAGRWLYDKGKAIIQGIIDGITSMIDRVKGAVKRITDTIGKFLPGSPVEMGPLTVLNRGHAGKEIIRMLVDGMESEGGSVVKTLATNLTLPQTAFATLVPGPGSPPTGAPLPSPGSSRLRLVQGSLTLDERGRAFITGLAEDVVAGSDADSARLVRQGRSY